MKAALYARVSSQGQADKDLSIPAQLKALREYALKKGWPVAGEYIDEAESARTADRPKFQEMVHAAKLTNKPFDVILVWKFSRFARNREDSILYKKLLHKHGVDVISINEPIDDSPSGHLMEAMLEAVDEFYSLNLSSDTIRGMKENATRGFRNGGPAPFGYMKQKVIVNGNEKVKLDIDPVESIMVKRIFDMCLRGYGLKETVRALNAEGLRTRSGRMWSITALYYVLTNETYIGNTLFNIHTKLEGRYVKNKPEKILRIPNTHPPILEKETFERAKALLRERAPKCMHPREAASEYLLSSMVYCKYCGAKMIGVSAKSGKFFYYACLNYLKRGKEGCSHGFVPQNKLDTAVVDNLRNCINEKSVKRLITMVNSEIIAAKGGIRDQIAAMELKIADVHKRLHKLYAALETGELELADLAPRIKDQRTQLAGLEETLRAIKERQERETIVTSDDEIHSYVENIQDFMSGTSLAESKTFLHSWVKRIEVDKEDGTADIKWIMPTVPGAPWALSRVLSMEKICALKGIRTPDLCLERAAS